MKTLFLVAGEASADEHASHIVRKLKQRHPDLKIVGIGGPSLRAEGMQTIVDSSEVDIVGITEVFSNLARLRSGYKRLKNYIHGQQIDAALLIDLPDLNLMLARHLKKRRIPVAYFVSPQIWVWRKYRIRKIKQRVDRMLVLFPFEKEFYRRFGVPAQFVGHPLVESIVERAQQRPVEQRKSAPSIAVLPGSRRTEIAHHETLVRDLVARLHKVYPRATFICPVAKTLDENVLKRCFEDLPVYLTRSSLQSVVAACDVSLTASGTASLETALVGTPQIVFYKVSKLTGWLFGMISKTRTFSLPNIILGKSVIPEFVQHHAVPQSIVPAVQRLIENNSERERQLSASIALRDALGAGGCADRVAEAVGSLLNNPSTPLETGFSGVFQPAT